MIRVTGLDHVDYVINAEQIEKIEEIPESVITLISGKKYLVTDSSEELINKIIEYKRRIYFNNARID